VVVKELPEHPLNAGGRLMYRARPATGSPPLAPVVGRDEARKIAHSV
jgi:hypothetical protein